MATRSFRAGPSKCYLSKLNGVALPSLATLAFTASGTDLGNSVYNSIQNPLDTTVTYQVVLAMIGGDGTTSGYSVGRGSPSSGNLTITSGQAIKLSVALGAWPAQYQTGFVGAFLKMGNADFRLAAVTQPSTVGTTEFLILTTPIGEQFTLAQLQSTTPSSALKALGDREPEGFTLTQITPTTGSVNISFAAGNSVTFSPNTSADFSVVGSRPINVNFQGMINSEEEIAKASAGDWAEWTTGGTVFQQGQFGFNTAQIVAKGNSPFIMEFPTDPDTGAVARVLCFGLLLQNQEELALAWSKSDQTALSYNFQAAPLDVLFNDQPTCYTYSSYST